MSKKQLSGRLNALLKLDPPIDFTSLRKDDLKRLLTILESKQGSNAVQGPRERPLLSRLKKRPVLRMVLRR